VDLRILKQVLEFSQNHREELKLGLENIWRKYSNEKTFEIMFYSILKTFNY
jgi:hypothetical protein